MLPEAEFSLDDLSELESLIQSNRAAPLDIRALPETELPDTRRDGADIINYYMREIAHYERIDAVQEFWLGVIIGAGAIADDALAETDGAHELPGFHLRLHASLRQSWLTLAGEARRFGRALPDMEAIIGEASMLRRPGSWRNPFAVSVCRVWLDQGLWGRDEEWNEAAKSLVEALSIFFLMPGICRMRLRRRLRPGGSSLPTTDEYLSWLPHPDLLLADITKVHDLADRAREMLVLANLRLVISIAREWQGRGLGLADLIQEGNIGLMTAVKRFDPALGHRFSTYATWWIRQAIGRGVANRGRLIRLPVHIHERLNALRSVQDTLIQQLGRHPTAEELLMKTDILSPEDREAITRAKSRGAAVSADVQQRWSRGLREISLLLSYIQEPVSLDREIGETRDSLIGDFVTDDPDPVSRKLNHMMLRETLNEIMNCLIDREREILVLRFGLNSSRKATLQEIGELFGVTRERVRQIESKALRKLRQPARSRFLRDFFITDD